MSTAARSSVFLSRDFVLYQLARLLLTLAVQMLSVAVAWYVYDLTSRPLDLGLVGLAQFLPMASLSLVVTGHVADRFERHHILVACYAGVATCAALLFAATRFAPASLLPVFGILALLGATRAFAGPAAQSFLPHLIPDAKLARGVAWSSTTFQVSTIAGPALGGVLYGVAGPGPVFAISAAAGALAAVFVAAVRARSGRQEKRAASWEQLSAGLRYVWRQKTILGSISLDLFAVLLGGAVALLPVYAKDILHIGPWGLGLLRSAPAAGAMTIAVYLGARPMARRAGPLMLACVAGFGLATVVFGFSRVTWLSLLALFAMGATDMVSVVVRLTLVQLATPPSMRGRVSAVNQLFISASNELGEFESGVAAAWLGAVPAVVAGGVGTMLVVALWAAMFPGLRRIDRLEDLRPETDPPADLSAADSARP